MNKITCDFCKGKGIIPEYFHRDGGNCYRCKGRGYNEVSNEYYNQAKKEEQRVEQKSIETKEIKKELARLEKIRKPEIDWTLVDVVKKVIFDTKGNEAEAVWSEYMAGINAQVEEYENAQVKIKELIDQYNTIVRG